MALTLDNIETQPEEVVSSFRYKQLELQYQTALNEMQTQNLLATQARQSKLEAVRLAKETLLENARSKSVDERSVSAQDIVAYAQTLVNYVQS
jgi:hypothetical protein